MLGGNVTALIQAKTSVPNEIGEYESIYTDKVSILGWIDQLNASDGYKYKGKFEDSTHVFICDYQPLNLKANECRLVYNNNAYEILSIDDPMELHEQLEILLKYTGVLNESDVKQDDLVKFELLEDGTYNALIKDGVLNG